MRKFVELSLLAAAAAWVFVTPAFAESFEVTDVTGTTYTLTVEEGCTVDCDVTVDVEIGAGDDGTFLDSIQWLVSGGTILDATLTSAPAGTGSWDTTINDAISNDPNTDNNCDDGPGGNPGSACSEWVETVGGDEGLLVNTGDTFQFAYLVDWETALNLDSTSTGTVRALYQDETGQIANLFSPGDQHFTTTTTEVVTTTTTEVVTTTQNVPEPTLLTLLGGGLILAGRRLRRTRK